MDKRFLIILTAAILIFGGIFWATKSKTNAPGSSNGNAASNHIAGNKDSSVKFVEYGDYQCPFCAQYYPIVNQVKQKYGNQISFQFRNFPLTQIHQNTMAASRAAEAAALQGKFWQMHDLLYENQSSWESVSSPTSMFDQYAQQLSLNMEQYRKDQNSPAVLATINADLAAGQAAGVNSTPTFFLDGKKLTSPPTDLAGFSKLIDAAIAAKKP